jgi:hypothetical protein
LIAEPSCTFKRKRLTNPVEGSWIEAALELR